MNDDGEGHQPLELALELPLERPLELNDRQQKFDVPSPSLIVLIGISGSGKSTFARKHFKQSQIVSSDSCRLLVADDENDQSATLDAFAVLHLIVRRRLVRGLLTVVDATNIKKRSREPLLRFAAETGVPALAVVLDMPQEIIIARHLERTDRAFPVDVIEHQHRQMRDGMSTLDHEGFERIIVLDSVEQTNNVSFNIIPTPTTLSTQHDPNPIAG